MEEQVELKLYTVADLKEYFIHNRPVELLSEKVINHTRAYATIMNPYAKDDTAVVSALFVDGEVAAFTYVIPDECFVNGKQRTIYWNTVLYVDSRYEGRGYGAIVIGQMVEVYGDSYFDLDAVPASVENLRFAGLQVDYVEQYILEQKHIQTRSLKGKLLKGYEKYRLAWRKCQIRNVVSKSAYSLRYVSYIDDETYDFIKEHSKSDMFLRSQVMFNWILNYPLCQESPQDYRVLKHCAFDSTAICFRFYATQVYTEGKLVGIYISRLNKEELYINYLYYIPRYEQVVYDSIMEFVIHIKPNRFFTANPSLKEYVASWHFFANEYIHHKSFSHPTNFVYNSNQFIQAGDGDNIT